LECGRFLSASHRPAPGHANVLAGACTEREYELISKQEIAISDIVLRELAKLTARGRLDLDLEGPQFRGFLRQMIIIPISRAIAIASTRLDFSSDPTKSLPPRVW
jgi:hypothetical protein